MAPSRRSVEWRSFVIVTQAFAKDDACAPKHAAGDRWAPRLSRAGWEAISNPRRIALVGASGRTSSVSFTSRFLQTNQALGFTGEIFLVNPARAEILGRKCWPDLASLREPVDIVAFNLPDEKVLPAVEEAIAHGARALMIHSGGFLERGAAGAKRQKELQRLCAEARIPALGPNCLGFLSFTNRVSISSFKIAAGSTAGSIAAISQSGSVSSLLQSIAGRHGLSFLASTGNEAVTGAEDLIAYAIEDPATRVIVAFVEGFRNPPDLFELAERAHAAEKPVILLKAGLTQDGGEVSRGHTGVIAGSGAVYRQALRQANFILVEDFDELAQTVELAASWCARPASFRVGMLGTSGGELGAVTDQCVEHGVTLPAYAAETLAALQSVLHLPADVWPRNPVDVGVGFNTPGSYEERMRGAIRAVAADPSVDVIAVLQGFHRDSPDLAYSLNREILGATAKESPRIGKPALVIASRAGCADDEVLAEVRSAHVPALEGSREALRAIRHLETYSRCLARWKARSSIWTQAADGVFPMVNKRDGAIGQAELFQFLAGEGLPAPPMRRVENKAEAERVTRELGPRVVMKIDSGRVVHKSDVGGVALDVTPEAAARTYDKLLACLDPPVGTFPGEGIVAAAQIESGVEVYVGAKRDESFGIVVVFGLGGRLLEILKLNAILVMPFDEADALEAIDRSGVRLFLDGFRGGPKADFDKLAKWIVRVGGIASATGKRLEVLELNPVIVNARHPGGVIADARLLLFPELRT
jgi:acyl-CoA synthetase (NDP forming)